MEYANWLNLPESNWIDIFDYLDVKSLKRVTETCRTFSNIFDSSAKLNRKIKLYINTDMKTETILETLESLKQSKRKYRNVELINWSKTLYEALDDMNKAELSKIQSALSELENAVIYDLRCRHLLMFEAATNLSKIWIKLRECELNHENPSTKFLSQQRKLKYLTVNSWDNRCILMPPLLPSSQLENLYIDGGHWASENDMLTFFGSQQNLRSIVLVLNEPWYSGIFELILLNKKLHTVEICGSLDGSVQLPSNVVCPSVVNLSFHHDPKVERTFFIEFLVKAFPNVRKFRSPIAATKTELVFISSWRLLESLELATKHGHLKELEMKSEGFKVFTYKVGRYRKNDKMLSDLGRFLRRHRTIRHLELIIHSCNRYKRYPDMLDVLIAENIPELETLSLT